MDRCRNILCLRPLGKAVYYCCNQFDKYCEECSKTHKCRYCKQFPVNPLSLRKCDICQGTANLLECKCSIVCQACTIRVHRCAKCSVIYQPVSSYSVPLQNPSSVPSGNYSEKVSTPPRKGSQQSHKEYCSKCYKQSTTEELFCNLNCGHLLCLGCMKYKPGLCPSAGCHALVDIQSSRLFLKLCLDCETPITKDLQGLNLCENCISRAREAQRVFDKEPSQIQQPEPETKNDPVETFDDSDAVPKLTITVSQIQQQAQTEQKVRATNHNLMSSNLSPRNNYLKKLPSINHNLLHPSRIPDDDKSTSRNKSIAKSVTSGVARQSRKQGRCTFCRVKLDYQFLISFQQCKKPSTKRHKGCMCCLMKTRGNRICRGCQLDQDQELKRKLTYQEMSDVEKLRFNQEIRTSGYSLCSKCQIVIQLKSLITGDNASVCKRCCLK